jgi:GxxExxY protein
MSVHQKLGNGFLESVYQEALEKEMNKEEIPFERQKKIRIKYEDEYLEKYFMADFVCYHRIILEIKAVTALINDHMAQVLNYLKATNYPVGLLINFGQPSLIWKRLILTHDQHQ